MDINSSAMGRPTGALGVLSPGVAGADGGMGGTSAGPTFMLQISYFVKEKILNP
jgi:hypothetical protein